MGEERRGKKGFSIVLHNILLAALRDEEIGRTADRIGDHPDPGAPAIGMRSNEFTQMPLASQRIRMGLDPAEVSGISWAASRTDRMPLFDPIDGNLALALTILAAIKIKESAGLARNPFTGRACYKLTDEEAARQATSDENTAQLVTLILETREPAFIDWAQEIEDRRQPKVSEGVTEETKPSTKSTSG
jgi:hypothetical protein